MGLYTLHTPRLGSRFKAAQSIWKLREIPQLRCFRRLGAPVFEGPCRKILGQKIRSTSFEGPCSKILGQKIRGTLFEGPCSKVLVLGSVLASYHFYCTPTSEVFKEIWPKDANMVIVLGLQ